LRTSILRATIFSHFKCDYPEKNDDFAPNHSRYNPCVMVDKRPEDLSVEELRRLLLDKRRIIRRDRLESFRRTGRVINITSDSEANFEDGPAVGRVVETPEEQTTADANDSPGKARHRNRWTDNVLLGVEVLAVLVLLGILVTGFSVLRTLNQEAAAANQPPTAVPTALITAVVLPSGHTPPTSDQGAQPNVAEIPEHLRPLVQALENIPVPTSSPQQGIRIQIPATGVDAPIVQGDGWEQLKKGVAQHLGTPNPGETGNVVFAAHNDIFGEIFRNLDKLQPGDVIILYTSARQFTYVVTGTQIVAPTRVDVMAPTPNAVVTLISCYPYLVDNQRIVVSAVLQNP
jgi:sortase A